MDLKTSRVYRLTPQQHYCSVFEEIIDETLQKKAHYEALCISRLLYLMALIQRDNAESDDSVRRQLKNVEYAIQHMNKYCDSSLKLEDYAAMCRMSKYHFLRVFKQVTGATPLEYRSRIRIEHAKELLENSYLTVSEISEALGYTSPAYFCDAFKKNIGCSPIEYRNGKRLN
ncbi:MAG: helix-turn-helix transcriptional regulator [Clostridia bacterium]|nr:helix-turn-helix transcriptional regulator [Clostridia bacterium]